MPELPEVETVARQLHVHVAGRVLRGVALLDPRLGEPPVARLAGLTVRRVFRLGKQVAFELSGAGGLDPAWLLVHLRMTGRLLWRPVPPRRFERRHLRATLMLGPGGSTRPRAPGGGTVFFYDPRRFGTIAVHRCLEHARPAGVDPLDPGLDAGRLAGLLGVGRQPIKPWLLRQDRLVGLGNIYACEILHRARIDPRRAVGSLTRPETTRLLEALRTVLTRAIDACGTTFSDFQTADGVTGSFQRFLRVYAREGQPCAACGAAIVRLVQQQRSTYFCPRCQRNPRRPALS